LGKKNQKTYYSEERAKPCCVRSMKHKKKAGKCFNSKAMTSNFHGKWFGIEELQRDSNLTSGCQKFTVDGL